MDDHGYRLPRPLKQTANERQTLENSLMALVPVPENYRDR